MNNNITELLKFLDTFYKRTESSATPQTKDQKGWHLEGFGHALRNIYKFIKGDITKAELYTHGFDIPPPETWENTFKES